MTEGLKSETLSFGNLFFEKIPPACLAATRLSFQGRLFSAKRRTKSSSLSPLFALYRKKVPGKSRYLSRRRRRDSTGFQPVVFALRTVYFMSLFAPQKDGRRVRVSCPFCNIQKKGTGENPDTFPGAEGETRRVFNPSCSLCEQFILCPFLLRKKMDEEFESLQTNSYIQKEKAQRKNPCAFSGAEGETRTLAPVTRPTPLAGAPRHQLEYFCMVTYIIKFCCCRWRREWDSNPRYVAVRRFSRPFRYNHFGISPY